MIQDEEGQLWDARALLDWLFKREDKKEAVRRVTKRPKGRPVENVKVKGDVL